MNNAQEAKMTAYAEEIRKRYQAAQSVCYAYLNALDGLPISAALADIPKLLEIIEEQRVEIERLKGLEI